MYSDSNFTTILAGEDLSDSEGCAVVAAGTVTTSAASIPVGFVVRGAANGLPILIQGGGYGLVKCNAAVTAGAFLVATGSGEVDDLTLTNAEYSCGVALETGSAGDHLIKALISIGAFPAA